MNEIQTLDRGELERVEGGGVLLWVAAGALLGAFAVGFYAGYETAHEG